MIKNRLASTPRLMTAYLIRCNRKTLPQLRGWAVLLAGAGLVALVLLYGERGRLAQVVEWLREHILAASGLASIATAIAVARRRYAERAEFAKSWLAALPMRTSMARWEALLIEMLPAAAVEAGLAGIFVGVAVSAPASSGSALALWASMSGGVAAGAIASYAIPSPKPIDLPPGSRYVPHRRVAKASALRPSLKALGFWPLRLMFARAQPKLVTRAILPVLVLMPIGTSAATAMCVIALYGVAGVLLLLLPAAISVSVSVRAWMAPLPVRISQVMQVVVIPTLGIIVGAGAAAGLLLFAMGVSLRTSLASGLCMAFIGCLLTLAAVQLRPTRVKRPP
jgi:hypothetical protein